MRCAELALAVKLTGDVTVAPFVGDVTFTLTALADAHSNALMRTIHTSLVLFRNEFSCVGGFGLHLLLANIGPNVLFHVRAVLHGPDQQCDEGEPTVPEDRERSLQRSGDYARGATKAGRRAEAPNDEGYWP